MAEGVPLAEVLFCQVHGNRYRVVLLLFFSYKRIVDDLRFSEGVEWFLPELRGEKEVSQLRQE